MKAYCTCRNPGNGRTLWNPYKEDWTDIAILDCCNKPCKGLWEAFLGQCENCTKPFSFIETLYSPWGPLSVRESPEDLYTCQTCTRLLREQEGQPPDVWRGWKWAAKQRPEWHPGYEPEGPSEELEVLREKPLDNLVALL